MNKQNKSAFTIIEVVLVLAIAGLIFMMVFLALPALQRSQGDTQRRNDISRFRAAITQYQSNNRGRLPENWDLILENYLTVDDSVFEDPSTGVTYVINSTTSTAVAADSEKGVIYVNTGSVCGNDEGSIDDGSARNVAVRIKLEAGGVYCEDDR